MKSFWILKSSKKLANQFTACWRFPIKNDNIIKDKVFILDDSEPFLKLLSFMIRIRMGLDSVMVTSFLEAKTKIPTVKDSIFVAILDLHLPDSSGYQHIDYFLSLGIPCIVLTGEFDAKIRETVFSQKNIIDYALKTRKEDVDYVIYLLGRLQKNRKIKIIVVDDSPDYRAMTANLLRMQMFEVLEAQNGYECLEILDTHKDTKMIITDYDMPGLNGFELTSEIRGKYSRETLSILGISDDSSKSISSRFIKLGVNDYLAKPFSKEEFFCRVNMNLENLENIEKMREIANHDFLTGLKIRRHFFELGQQAIMEKHKSISFGMIDIDHFKKINDTYGHEAGDFCLKFLAKEMKKTFEDFGFVGRIGGEEFSVILLDIDEKTTIQLFEDFRYKIAHSYVSYEKKNISFTISSGVCTYQSIDSMDIGLRQADALLYKSKSEGRNRVSFLNKN